MMQQHDCFNERKKVSFPADLWALLDGRRTLLAAIRMRDDNAGTCTDDETIAALLDNLRCLEALFPI